MSGVRRTREDVDSANQEVEAERSYQRASGDDQERSPSNRGGEQVRPQPATSRERTRFADPVLLDRGLQSRRHDGRFLLRDAGGLSGFSAHRDQHRRVAVRGGFGLGYSYTEADSASR